MSNDDVTALGRTKFLESTKVGLHVLQLRWNPAHPASRVQAHYWSLFESGFLARDNVNLLIEATELTESIIEKHPQRDIKSYFKDHLLYAVSPPTYVNWLHKMPLPRVLQQPMNRLAHFFVQVHATRVTNLVDAFVLAHRQVGDVLLSSMKSGVSMTKMLHRC